MSADHRVTGRKNVEVREITNRTKAEYGVADRRPVSIIDCLESGRIPTTYGRKTLEFNVVDDEQLGGDAGKTEFKPGKVIITVKRSVYTKAKWGDGRARMTLAHELAHGVMHHTKTMHRRAEAAGTTELSKNTAYESAEHQAKVFAAAFLVHDHMAKKMLNAEEISAEFLVSLEAAEICFERLEMENERAKSAERVMKMSEEAKLILRRSPQPLPPANYLEESCPSCGFPKLQRVDSKYRCDNCRYSGDLFQDGDKAGGSLN